MRSTRTPALAPVLFRRRPAPSPQPAAYPQEGVLAESERADTLGRRSRLEDLVKQFADRPDDYRERMACFSQVEERLIDNCGHNLHHDQPEIIANLLDDFFRATCTSMLTDMDRAPCRSGFD
ncbi:MAG: hypothetical protein IPI89_01580 [Propionivibrio sp.]|nr:hypothetical protein [Propionivibrio sp.]